MDQGDRLKKVEDMQQYILQQLSCLQHQNYSYPPSAHLSPNYLPFSPRTSFASTPTSLHFPLTSQSSQPIPYLPPGPASYLPPTSQSTIPYLPPAPASYMPPVSQSSHSPSTPSRPQANATTSPLPLTKLQGNALPSSSIDKSKLLPVEKVIEQYPKLKSEGKAGTLACKIAKQALFGVDIMKRCTPIGNRELPGLPVKELKELKKVMFTRFPQYWKTPVEFESVWKKCLESVQQGCKRLRLEKDT